MAREGIELEVDASEIIRAARVAPIATYFWMREFLGHALVSHRVAWLRRKGIKFGRGAKGIQVPRVNEGPELSGGGPFRRGRVPARHVVYQVHPDERRTRNPLALRELHAQIVTGSKVLEAHEQGAHVRPRRTKLLAVPLTTPRGGRVRLSPWEARKRGAELVSFRSRSGALLLAERKRKRIGTRQRFRRLKSGRLAKSQPKTKVDILLPKWALVPGYKIPPSLDFFQTWDDLRAQRNNRFRRNTSRLVRDIARGILT